MFIQQMSFINFGGLKLCMLLSFHISKRVTVLDDQYFGAIGLNQHPVMSVFLYFSLS